MARIEAAAEDAIAEAAGLLRRGELVCFPTETVYGVGANASSEAAVKSIFRAKGRPADHPLIVHIPDAGSLEEWSSEVPEDARRLADEFWPGPLTIVLKRSDRVPLVVTGGQDTVALRVPAHPVALALLAEFGSGIAAPSANRYGRISPTRASHAAQELGDSVALVLDGGATEVGLESTIVDLSSETPRLLRPGAVTKTRLSRALGGKAVAAAASDGPRAPGTVPSHYAPDAPVRLVPASRLLAVIADARAGEVAVLARRERPAGFEGGWLRLPETAQGYGRELYAALREADSLDATEIVVEEPPDGEEWEAVRDRLGRAAGGRRDPGDVGADT